MGTDKLGHFVTVGLAYYKKYLQARFFWDEQNECN